MSNSAKQRERAMVFIFTQFFNRKVGIWQAKSIARLQRLASNDGLTSWKDYRVKVILSEVAARSSSRPYLRRAALKRWRVLLRLKGSDRIVLVLWLWNLELWNLLRLIMNAVFLLSVTRYVCILHLNVFFKVLQLPHLYRIRKVPWRSF